MYSASRSVTPDFDTKHPVKLTKIGDLDMLGEAGLECVDSDGTAGCDHAVIHVHCDGDYCTWGLGVFVENGLVDLALLETEGSEDLSEFLVSTPTSLLEPIQRLVKAQNATRVVLAISRGVTHIQHFFSCEFSVQICTLDVDLVQNESKAIGHCNDGMQGWESCNLGIGNEVVDSLDLAEPLCNETSFVLHDFARGVFLGLKDPLRTNDVDPRWCVLKHPSSSGMQGVELIMYSLLPQQPVRPVFCLSQVSQFECFRIRGLSH